jgi:hypothetical protein
MEFTDLDNGRRQRTQTTDADNGGNGVNGSQQRSNGANGENGKRAALRKAHRSTAGAGPQARSEADHS